MQNHFIYSKSAKGQDETATHPHRLAPRYRRFLALVDGRRSVAELATVARPGELFDTLEYLIENGFIEKVGQTPEETFASDDDPFAAVALTADMFEEFRHRATQQLTAEFGPAAEAAIREINKAATPAELRAALRATEGLIADTNGPVNPDEVRKLFLRIGRNFI